MKSPAYQESGMTLIPLNWRIIMLKSFIVLCLGFYGSIAMSQTTQHVAANDHDDNHYIMLGVSVSIVEGLSLAAAAKHEVQESEHITIAPELKEIENPGEGLSLAVNTD